MGGGERSHLRDRLHRADLVIGGEHGDERDIVGAAAGVGPDVGERRRDTLDQQHALGIDVEPGDPRPLMFDQPLHRVEGRVVLGARNEQTRAGRRPRPRLPEQPLHGEVHRLRATAREGQLDGVDAHGRGNTGARFFPQRTRGLAGGMQ